MAAMKILLVEDDEAMGSILSHTLRSGGYQVTWAKDGVQALSLAKTSAPDLIITDFVFPAGGGATLVQRLRVGPQTQMTPIIVLSAVPKELITATVGADLRAYYLPKPYKKADLLSLVEGLLQGSVYENFLLHQPGSENAPPAPKPSRGTVVIISPAKEERANVRSALEKKDFRVIEAADGAEVLSALGLDSGSARADAPRPNLIVLDAQADSDSGHAINARLSHEPSTRSVPVLVLTSGREQRAAFSDAMNVSAFLDKPVDPTRLLRHVEELLPAKR